MFGSPFAAWLKLNLKKKNVRQIANKYIVYFMKSAEYLKHKRVVPLDLEHVNMRPRVIRLIKFDFKLNNLQNSTPSNDIIQTRSLWMYYILISTTCYCRISIIRCVNNC